MNNIEENKKISEYSIKELRGICQLSAPNPANETFTGRFTRIFSIYITKILLYTKITPNQITILSVLVFFSGILMFFYNDYYLNLAGVFLVFFSIVLDGSDGETARFRKSGGAIGSRYVEPISHDIQFGFSYILLGLALYINGFSAYYLLLGGIASMSKLLYRLLKVTFWALVNKNITSESVKEIKESYSKKSGITRLIYWTERNFFSSTGFLLMIFIFSVLNRIDLALWIFCIGNFMYWLALFSKQIYRINKDKII